MNHFKFIETYFMAKNMVCLGKWFMCTWKESWVEWAINVRSSWLIESLKSSLSLLILCLSTCSSSFWEKGIEISDYTCGFVNFCLYFYQFPFVYFEFLLLNSCIFRIVVISWWIGSLYHCEICDLSWNLWWLFDYTEFFISF